jgi:putative ABC transport system ATP-binding protein
MHRIEALHLSKTYGQGPLAVRALADVSLAVSAGEIVGLLGPSGSGKSTLLTCMGLLDPPDEGEIRIDGRTVVRRGAFLQDPATLRRQRIGFVFQRANLVPFLDVMENILLPLRLEGSISREQKAHVEGLLERLDLLDRRSHAPEALSGGQRQRVALARALAARPSVVLADEPTAALDARRGREAILALRDAAREAGAAVVVVTHDARILDAFDRTIELEDGQLVAPTHG